MADKPKVVHMEIGPQYKMDIVAALRSLADELEQGPCKPTSLLIVHDDTSIPGEFSTYTQGLRSDDLPYSLGLLEIAKANILGTTDANF